MYQFLENLEKFYDIIIFTASLSQYENPVLDIIDKKGFRLYREHCFYCINEFGNNFIIPIKTWIEDLNDKELYKLEPYLIFSGNNKIDDVRFFFKNINSGNILD